MAEFVSGATAASAALAGVPTHSGYTLVEMAEYTYIRGDGESVTEMLDKSVVFAVG